jgi:gamma-glutamyltranspeptidase/glutathione hydrolase
MRHRWIERLLAVGLGLGLALQAPLGAAATGAGGLRIFPPVDASRTRASYVAHGTQAMVATAHPEASKAGLAMLKAGGNAIDAAVAASFVISVVRPQSTGLGGGGFMLSYLAGAKAAGKGQSSGKGETEVYDFRERAPKAATRDMFLDAKGEPKGFTFAGQTVPDASVNGHLAVGTPGLVAGLLKAHEEHGKLKLATVMAPAIALAENGFPVYGGLASELESRKDVLKVFPSSTKIFFKDGRPLRVGETLVQKDLAKTLRAIERLGVDGFYKGEVAAAILAEMKRGGGLVTQADLDAYAVKMRTPVSGAYRGYTILSMPPPSSGGAHIIQILNMLENGPDGKPSDYGALGLGTVPAIHLLAEAMRRAFADRAEYLGDPEFVTVPLKGLLSPKYAQKLRATIDMTKATPSTAVKPGDPASFEHPSTTHLSVLDADGNAVSTTQTVNYGFGSCVVAEGTGVVLNDEMDDFAIKPGVANVFGLVGNDANAVAASKTMLSSMSPTLVFRPDGSLFMVVGSPGGPRIITATLQTIINAIDFKLPLADAVHATRTHNQWLPDELRVEPDGLDPAVAKALEAMGHKLVVKGSIGDVQAIEVAKGDVVGVSDTRSEGVPMGL